MRGNPRMTAKHNRSAGLRWLPYDHRGSPPPPVSGFESWSQYTAPCRRAGAASASYPAPWCPLTSCPPPSLRRYERVAKMFLR